MSLSPEARRYYAIRQMIMLSKFFTSGRHGVAVNDNPGTDLPIPA